MCADFIMNNFWVQVALLTSILQGVEQGATGYYCKYCKFCNPIQTPNSPCAKLYNWIFRIDDGLAGFNTQNIGIPIFSILILPDKAIV